MLNVDASESRIGRTDHAFASGVGVEPYLETGADETLAPDEPAAHDSAAESGESR